MEEIRAAVRRLDVLMQGLAKNPSHYGDMFEALDIVDTIQEALEKLDRPTIDLDRVRELAKMAVRITAEIDQDHHDGRHEDVVEIITMLERELEPPDLDGPTDASIRMRSVLD